MSDFIIGDTDYIDFIKDEEDMKLFNRLKELYPLLNKPANQCAEEIKEFIQTEDRLMKQPIHQILIMKDPKLN